MIVTFTERLVAGGDCALSIREYVGAGPDVLLMHGAGRNQADWGPYVDDLAVDHRVVSMDLRGHGKSGDASWTLDGALADIDRVIEATGLQTPALVGHSLGGMLAALYSARGGAVRAVVNMDGYGHGTPDQYVGLSADEISAFQDLLATMIDAPRPDAAGPLDAAALGTLLTAQLTQAATLGLPAGLELTSFARNLSDVPGGVVLRPAATTTKELMAALGEVNWFEIFGAVTAPFLIYRCEQSMGETGDLARYMQAYTLGMRRDLDALAARSANVTARVLQTHHGFILTMPEELADQTRAFLRAL